MILVLKETIFVNNSVYSCGGGQGGVKSNKENSYLIEVRDPYLKTS